MTIILQRIAAALIGGCGLLALAAYAAVIVLADDRGDAAQSWGGLAGFALLGVFIAAFWFGSTVGRAAEEEGTLWAPPIWLSLLAFAAIVAGGFALRWLDRGVFVAPVLAVLAFVAVAAFFLRLAAIGLPGKRPPRRNVVVPFIWGALVAPVMLLVIQGAAAALLIVGAIIGIYVDDPDFEIDPNLEQRIVDYFESAEAGATSTVLPDVVATPTIALAAFALVAVIAPFSEELVKGLGAILVLSRRARLTRSDAYIAGVAAGLGFAVLEGVGYTLASPASWQQVIIIRAPVVIVHIAATTIVTLGWLRMRDRKRGFLPYFGVAVALHAAWNALSLGFVMSLVGLEEGAVPSGGQALAIGMLIVTIGLLFAGACAWVILAARMSGKSDPAEHEPDRPLSSMRSMLSTRLV